MILSQNRAIVKNRIQSAAVFLKMHSLHDYYYELPHELIAQTPCEQRDGCRLLVLDRKTGNISHRHFYDIVEYLRPGDALVINDSRVIPARIYGVKRRQVDDGNEPSRVECLLLRQRELDTWECIVHPGKRVKTGAVIDFSGIMTGTVVSVSEDGNRMIRFSYDKTGGETVYSVLERIGKMPLPPYITEELDDNDKYQTVYANENGSAAAPTAGLHFTEELLEKIKNSGVDVIRVMLHVGLGTCRPVKCENIEEHKMHSEFFTVTADAAERINAVRKRGGRIIAVGTTSCRTLESAADDEGTVHAESRDTDIFIYPPYKFKAVDALITNFHLPESTLLMLISAFADRETVMKAYAEAVKERYRFFSFGDAMLIL